MYKRGVLQRYGRQICLLSVLILLSSNLFARPQSTVRITLQLDNVTLETAIDAIEKQSPYLFVNKEIDFSTKVSVSVSDETIENTCKALFSPIGVSYRIEETYIYLTKLEPVRISGTILDQSGYPIPGAAVIESGTANGTTTDLDGNFSLTVSSASASIEIAQGQCSK